MSVLPDSSSQESSDPPSAGAEVAGSPDASFSLPGQGSDLIKMQSLWQWPCEDSSAEASPFPLPPPAKAISQPLHFPSSSKADASILPGLAT